MMSGKRKPRAERVIARRPGRMSLFHRQKSSYMPGILKRKSRPVIRQNATVGTKVPNCLGRSGCDLFQRHGNEVAKRLPIRHAIVRLHRAVGGIHMNQTDHAGITSFSRGSLPNLTERDNPVKLLLRRSRIGQYIGQGLGGICCTTTALAQIIANKLRRYWPVVMLQCCTFDRCRVNTRKVSVVDMRTHPPATLPKLHKQ